MSIRRRLEALEEIAGPRDFAIWPMQDQLEEVAGCLRIHRLGGTRQLATDRQIHLMGLLCALWELPDGVGEHRFPSGVEVTWSDNADGTQSVEATGYISLEDLPEEVREYFERMDPAEQPERDQRLYELWQDEQLYRGEGRS